ncbi:alpha/beta hydrolase [Salibaculum sp.]|jgi:pimeloyl-ACP methyl ester carboxylesterase|uniref:alpha/beta fold hydrolase n=1 Tax=Salibaculum sp. TaxID=2855480 RepID=UPI002B48CC7A|nr:alpha/beta hydrolase [Salibaculum sp.]HKL70001.1 alpha/beta hydrolase [Salibaculum sp.]
MPHFEAADGTRLFYEERGEGPPVLALAGLTRNSGDFDHVAPHLPCHLIRMDYRGRGQSDWADPTTYTVPQEAADAVALLDHLGLDRAAVLGTSRGGLIAMMLAATHKDRLSGVALNDIGPEIDPAGLKAIESYIGRNPPQKTHEEAALFRARNWLHFKGVAQERWLHEVRNHYAETPDGLVVRYDPKLRVTVFENAQVQPAPDLWPLFGALHGLPLCLIRGANSDLLTKVTWDRMRRLRHDAIAAEVPDRGHVPFLDEPQAVHALQSWIATL